MLENALRTKVFVGLGEAMSRVDGRINYVIRLEMKDKRATVGGHGQMTKRNLMSARLDSIAKHGITWAEYTYKKDCCKMVEELENLGFSVSYLQ